MPYIEVRTAGELTVEQKRELAKVFTEAMQRIAGKPASYTYIVFDEVERENWAVGGELLSEE